MARALAGMLAVAAVVPATAADARPGPGEPTRLLVTYAAPVDGDAEAGTFATASVESFPHMGTGAPRSAVQVLEFGRADEASRAARDLRARPDVLAVETDHVLRPAGSLGGAFPLAADGDDASLVAPTFSWGVENDGRSHNGVTGQRGIDVGATHVAGHATGRGVVVAVIDTGVDISHPLLRDRMWRNPDERVTGTDTDGNGYVDDLHGWDFVNDRPQVFRSATLDAHGTHVAGVVAGEPHEASGFRGVAPDARIMSLKFIEADIGYTSDAIAAIRYAVANGADVINASWGGPEPSTALRTALAESPVPIVVAAGNLGERLEVAPSYPASFGLQNVIEVAAVDHTGAMPDFSSHSRDLVDVAAPGALILSTAPGEKLGYASGTSVAAPHVAGVLALALERHPDQDPTLLASAVRATVRPLSTVAQTRSGGIVRAPALLDLLGSRIPACQDPAPASFTDVPVSNVHSDAVDCLVSAGITRGVSETSFGAAAGLTRAQIATLVAQALDRTDVLPPPPATNPFTDVLSGNVHRDAILTLAQLGIVRGVTTTTYHPDRVVTRAELAAVTARAAEYLAGGDIRAVGPAFVDTAGIPETVEIDKSAGLRIVRGRADGFFEPATPVRRDQAATMVSQLLDRMVQQGLIEAI